MCVERVRGVCVQRDIEREIDRNRDKKRMCLLVRKRKCVCREIESVCM